jgi:regulator of sirC expression with transglutaminase-like and TPR domain
MTAPDINQPGFERLASALDHPQEQADIGLLALLVAACHYPSLSIETYLQRLDEYAQRVRSQMNRLQHSPLQVMHAINQILFVEEGFRGNEEDYYNPANSFLNEVMETKRGIPISLSVLYLATAHRLHAPVFGVSLPMHFVVKYVCESGEIYLDPFYRGKPVTLEECRQRLALAYGAPVEIEPAYLHAASNRQILFRMLNNLKLVYLQTEEYERAGKVVEQMLIVRPDLVEGVRDRGLIYLQQRHWTKAIEWLQSYLKERGEAQDAPIVRKRLEQAIEIRARSN